jgi:5-hydroxyisourate hydrolase
MTTKDPITCHILDTTAGRPAAHVLTTLFCISSQSPGASPRPAFTAVTNSDGRITNWDAEVGSATIGDLIREHAQKEATPTCPRGSSIWQMNFNTGAYYGVEKTFFPAVALTFFVREGEHFHVPLLLSPFSYTTYRGS